MPALFATAGRGAGVPFAAAGGDFPGPRRGHAELLSPQEGAFSSRQAARDGWSGADGDALEEAFRRVGGPSLGAHGSAGAGPGAGGSAPAERQRLSPSVWLRSGVSPPPAAYSRREGVDSVSLLMGGYGA